MKYSHPLDLAIQQTKDCLFTQLSILGGEIKGIDYYTLRKLIIFPYIVFNIFLVYNLM